MSATIWTTGTWNVICDVCGFRYKANEIKHRWDGLVVCPQDWEERHPMDLFQAREEKTGVPFTRPEPVDQFTTVNYISTSVGVQDTVGIPDSTFEIQRRVQVISDDFNRTGGLLGSNWTDLITASTALIVNDMVRGTSLITGSAAIWTGSGTLTANQYADVEIRSLNNLSTDYWIGVLLRASTDTDANRDYYLARVFENSAGPTYTTEISKVVNSSLTVLYSAAQSWTVSDRIGLEAVGTSLMLTRNGVALGGGFTLTDSTLTTGRAGIFTASNSSSNGILDNFRAGNINS